MIDLWEPSSTGEIAARARMDVRVVSSLPGRLADRGAVLVDGTGRRRRYAATERLYSVYYKLRRERDDAAVVHSLILFLTTFYSDDELATLAVSDSKEGRVGISAAPDLEVEVAKVLFNKRVTHGQRDEADEALAAYDAVAARFGDSDAPDLQLRVAKAMVNKGVTHGQRGESDAELAAYDAVVDRFGGSDAPDIRQVVASALVAKGYRQVKIGRAEEALRTSDELERRYSGFTDDASVAFELWRAKWMRTHALIVQGEHQAALSALRSVCAMFVVDNAPMLREILARVPTLIAVGAAVRDVIEILSADGKTADAVAPLVVALRQLAGESVRASTEVPEVAADVRKRIEETRTAWRSMPSR